MVSYSKAKQKSYMLEYQSRPEVKARRKAYVKEYYSRPEVKVRVKVYRKNYEARPEFRIKKKAYQKKYTSNPEVKVRLADQVALKIKIHNLRSLPKRTPMQEERLGCYERAYELNFLDKANPFNVSEPKIPLCAVNAGKKVK